MSQFRIFLFFLLVSEITAANSGGWVGNSPMQVTAFTTPTTIYSSNYSNNEESEKKWNSLLLPEGDFRATLRAEYFNNTRLKNHREELYVLSIGLDYAFTENLTTFSLFQWGYNLKAGNGLGSEVAVLGGICDIFYQNREAQDPWHGDKQSDLIISYCLGIGYSYSTPDWRATARVYLVQNRSGIEDHGPVYSLGEYGISYFLSQKWAAGFSAESRMGAETDRINGKRKDARILFHSPQITLTRKISDSSEVFVSTQIAHSWNVAAGYRRTW